MRTVASRFAGVRAARLQQQRCSTPSTTFRHPAPSSALHIAAGGGQFARPSAAVLGSVSPIRSLGRSGHAVRCYAVRQNRCALARTRPPTTGHFCVACRGSVWPDGVHFRISHIAQSFQELATTVAPALGIVLSNAMYMAPLKAVLDGRSEGKMPLATLPFAAQLMNCTLWSMFAFARQDMFIFWSNAPGLVLSLFFITSAMPLITKPARLSLEKASVVALTVGVVSAFVSGFVLAPAEAEQLLGALGAAGAIAFFGVPLSGAMEILRTKNASSLSLPVVIAMMANSMLWTIYGTAIGATAVILPNAFGVAAATAQLALLMRFGSRAAAVAK